MASTERDEVVVEIAHDDVEDEGTATKSENSEIRLMKGDEEDLDGKKSGILCCRGRKGKDKKEGKKIRVIQWWTLYHDFRPLNLPLVLLAVAAAMANGCTFPVFSIIFGKMFQVFYDEEDDQEAKIRWYALGFLGLGFVSFCLYYIQTCIFSLCGEQVSTKLRKKVFQAVMRNDVAFIDRHTSGDITSRLASDIALVQLSCSEKVGLLILNMTQAVGGMIVAFIYGWKMTLVLLSVTPLLGIAFTLFAKVLMQSTGKGQDAYSDANAIASEAIQGFRTVLSFIREDYEIKRFSDSLDRTYKEGKMRSHLLGMGMGFVNLVMFGTYALGFWYGGQLVMDGEMDVGDMLIVFFSVIMGAMGLGQAGSLAPDFTKGAVAAGTLYDLVDEKPNVKKNEGGPAPKESFPGDIHFQNISFTYPSRPDSKVLKGITFSVPEGSVVALVGQSGGGKSTVLQLLERFYDPTDGDIIVDGVNLRDYDLEAYRSKIGLVAQEPILFSGTIMENIRYGRLDASDQEIMEAAKAANAHNFITDLPGGYETTVGEKGSQLSGGQKQRVAIARAILKDPRLLLLDEATSALDTESEELVQEALDHLMKNRTTIVIAHRLSTIRNADVIYVFDHGKLVESGNHDQLMGLKRYYYALVFRQVEGGDDEGDEGEDGHPRKHTRTRRSTVNVKVNTYDQLPGIGNGERSKKDEED